jgi:pilus assembly protein CpaC
VIFKRRGARMLKHSKKRHVLLSLVATLLVVNGFDSQELAFAQSPSPKNTVANDPVFVVTAKKTNVRIVEKFAKIIKLRERIATVYGFDQEVISVSKVDRSPNMIRVHATAPGVTSMVLVDKNNTMYTVEVFVTGDVRHLQAYLNRFFPHSSVEAVAIGDTVVLRGWVTQPEHITEMREIAERFYPNVLDQMKVGGVQQVLLKVRVMEVQRSKIRRFGFNFLYRNNNGGVVSTPGSLTPLTAFSSPFSSAPAIAVAGLADPTVAFAVLRDNNVFQGFVEALKEESLLKILAEPELVTTNGRPASLLSGGEFPILVPQSLGTTTIEWRQFGVRLEAVPIILGRGRVRLELQPEVSERDLTNSVEVNGLRVPGLTTRRVNTQVEMRFGETFMIAGLLSTRTTATTSKVPILGELPWIGSMFRRIRYEEGETELVILVTPELVAPMDGMSMPKGGVGLFTESPTDRELFVDGRMEVTKYSERCVGCDPGPFSHSPISGPRMKGVTPLAPSANYDRIPESNNQNIPFPPSPGSERRTAPSTGNSTPLDFRTSQKRRSAPTRSGQYSSRAARSRWNLPGPSPSTRTPAPQSRIPAGRPGLIEPGNNKIRRVSSQSSSGSTRNSVRRSLFER